MASLKCWSRVGWSAKIEYRARGRRSSGNFGQDGASAFSRSWTSKVNWWSQIRMRSPSTSVTLARIRSPRTSTPLADRKSETTKLVPVSMMTAWWRLTFGVVEDDVVVGQATDPGGRRHQWILVAGRVAQAGDGGCGAHRSPPVEGVSGVYGGGPCDPLHVQRFLAQDPLVEGLQRGAGIDAQILGECAFQPSVCVERVGLAFGEVVGAHQLCPQRLAVRMFGGQ